MKSLYDLVNGKFSTNLCQIFLPVVIFWIFMLLPGCRIEIDSEAEPETQTTASVKQNLGELTGNWILSTYVRDQELVILMLEVQQENSMARIGVKEMAPGRKPLGVKTIDFQPDSGRVEITFVDDKGDLTFKGKLNGDEIRGITQMSSNELAFSKLVKTAVLTLEGQGKLSDVPEAKKFSEAFNATDKISAFNSFIDQHPNSHLVFKALELVFEQVVYDKKSDSQVIEIFNRWKDSGLKWGVELLPSLYTKSINLLGNAGYSLEMLLQLEHEFQELAQTNNLTLSDNEINQMNFGKALSKLNTSDEAIQEDGVKDLEMMIEKNPLELLISYRIITHYFSQEKWEKVLEKSAPYLTLPLLEQIIIKNQEQNSGFVPPSNLFVTAWGNLNKDHRELQTYLDESFLKTLDFYTGKPVKPEFKVQPTRPLLLEMHTGVSCDNCVALELVCSQILQKYGKDNLTMIRFHQHGENGDPLTQQEGELRFKFITEALGQKSGVVPMLMINGLNMPDVTGGLSEVKELYAKVCKYIDEQISIPPQVNFKSTVNVEGDMIKVNVEGEKLPEDFVNLKLRLHFVLTEKKVKLIAPNGILIHENVVRALPYGAYGRPYTNETLSFTQEFDVNTLRQNQEQYLKNYEKSKDGKFAAHPVDMNKLVLTVFVQSYITGQIMNTFVKEFEEDFGGTTFDGVENVLQEQTLNRNLPPVPSLPE